MKRPIAVLVSGQIALLMRGASSFAPSVANTRPRVVAIGVSSQASTLPRRDRMPLRMSPGQGFGSDEKPSPAPTTPVKSAPAKSTKNSQLGAGGQFELQEMKFQLSAMKKAGVSARNLAPEKRDEIASYVREAALRIASPVPLKDLAEKDRLVGRWELAFSTEPTTLGDLPREANVVIDIQEGNKLDYILKFSKKVWGLKEITAKSTYTVDASPVNPGLVTFIYQEIVSGVFGLTVPVGLFGLLKGRANYIESVWFDGKYWIDRGYTPEGVQYFNVYVREDDLDQSRY